MTEEDKTIMKNLIIILISLLVAYAVTTLMAG